MLGSNRGLVFYLFAATIFALGLISLGLSHYLPSAPSKVVLATAFKGSNFEYDGKRYQEIFARHGLELQLRETAGAVENLKLLEDPNSDVQAAFFTGGISDAQHSPDVLSLGLIYYNPFWIFYSSGVSLSSLEELKGKRIAVGPAGSGTRFAAEKILGRAGITSESATFVPIAGNAAADALRDGRIDAGWFNGGPEAPANKSLLEDSRVRLMDFPMAEAFTRMFPDVVKLTLPQGVINVERSIPPKDVTLIGTTNKVLIRSDLHPEIVHLLLRAMTEVHRGQGIFQRVGEFPNPNDTEYPVAASAVDFYKNGPSFFQRHLPSWLIVHAQRAIAALVTLFAIGLPLFSYAPRIYRWLVEHRVNVVYRRLRAIEAALQNDISRSEASELEAKLEQLDQQLNSLRVPMQYSDIFFRIKSDLDLVRERLATRRTEPQKNIAL
jgi:TRAP transporter TAXI family solute receptor